MRSVSGISLLELLAGVTLAALAASLVLPALGDMRSAALAAAGARHLAATLQGTRWKSVAQGRTHGLRFIVDSSGWSWYEVQDGNGNGLRTSEILAGVDPTLSGPHRLEHVAQGVRLGLPQAGPFPEVPPGSGWIEGLSDPVRFGNTDLVSFGALGTSSSGTLYVTDGDRQLFAVVLYGKTAKIKVWRYVLGSGRWRA